MEYNCEDEIPYHTIIAKYGITVPYHTIITKDESMVPYHTIMTKDGSMVSRARREWLSHSSCERETGCGEEKTQHSRVGLRRDDGTL